MSMYLSCLRAGLLAMLMWPLSLLAADITPLTLGIHPYLPPGELIKRFTPVANHLGEAIQRPIEVHIASTYQQHIDAIGRNEIDVAFVGPSPYVDLVKRYGPKPMLGRLEINGKPVFDGYIVTRRDSPLQNLNDLRNKTFAFVDKESTMGFVVPRFVLAQANLALKDLAHHDYLGAHYNVAMAVLAGDTDAGAVKDEVFAKFEAQGLRALAVTPKISEHLFVTSTKLPAASVEKLRHALLTLKDSGEGQLILRGINPNATGLVAVQDSDYDNLRQIMATVAALPAQ